MYLRKITLGMIIYFIVLPCMSVYAADVAKIGVVDLQRVLMTSDPGKVAQDELKKQGAKIEGNFRSREGEVVKLKEAIEQEAFVMNRETREEKEREYRIKLNDLKSLQKKSMLDLKELENRLVSRIRKELMVVIDEIGKKEGYLLIIDKAVTYYYPSAIDVTDSVIRQYNAESLKKKTD